MLHQWAVKAGLQKCTHRHDGRRWVGGERVSGRAMVDGSETLPADSA